MLRVQPVAPLVGRRDVVQPARTSSRPKPASRLPVPAPAPVPAPVSPSTLTTTWCRVPTGYGCRTLREPPYVYAAANTTPARVPSPSSIPQLRDALSSLDSKVAALLSERARLALSLEQAVRMQSPIRRLPSEILSHIFSLGVLEPGNDEPPLLSNLMLVCRHWAALVRDTSALWSTITISPHHPLSRARVRLARSKSVPLDISIVFDTRRSPVTACGAPAIAADKLLTRALDLLVPHIARWRSFHLAVPESAQAHAALARCTAPALLLTSLTVRIFNTLAADDETDAPRAPALLTGLAPRLRAVRLHALALTPALDARLAGLRVLDLGGYWSGAPPRAAAILATLRACPELEELSLRSMADDDAASDPRAHAHEAAAGACIPPAGTIVLPRLRRATFHYAGARRARAVLAQLSFPALEELELCYLDDAALVLPHLGRQALTSLPLRRLRIEQGACAERELLKLFARVPTLTALELIDVQDISSSFLERLASPLSNAWLCPNLETLTLDGCTALAFGALHTFVSARLSPQARAYPRTPHAHRSTAPLHTTVPTHSVALSHDRESMRPLRASRPALASCRSQSTPPADDAPVWPRRLRRLGLARCGQFSREMLQWLRMYVPEVVLEGAREPAYS